LLPSQPPQNADSLNTTDDNVPSAPLLPLDDISSLRMTSNPSHAEASNGAPSTRSMDTIVPQASSSRVPLPYEDYTEHPELKEDKQELERRRLLAQISAPPTDEDAGSSATRSQQIPGASAPSIFDNEEDYNARTLHHDHNASDSLPQYER